MSSNPQVVVIGAGMCGLYAARRLAQSGIQVTVLERMDRVGGLAASMERDGVNYDLGVKHLHAHDGEIFADVKSLMGDDLLPVQLLAKIRFGDQFRQYPLKLADLLTGIPPWTIAWLFGGLSAQQIRNHFGRATPKNAEEALIQLYGGPLYRYFFRDFTHRYWGIPPTELSATFVSRKMPKLGAVDLLKQFFAKLGAKTSYSTDVENALAEETLHYARDGAIAIPRRLSESIQADGGRIITDAKVKSVCVKDNAVRKVVYQSVGRQHEIECAHLISTMPLPLLVRAISPACSENVARSATKLQFRPIVVYGMLIRRRRILGALYVYYRNRMFHRIAEPTESGLDAKNEEYGVLLVECTCSKGDDVWRDSPRARSRLFEDLGAESVIKEEEVLAVHHQRSEFGYPVFALGFEEHLDRVTNFLEGIENLKSIGRQGAFCYPNMHETMRHGAEAAKSVSAEPSV